MEKKLWGSLNGKEVFLYTLKRGEIQVTVTNYGATLVGIKVPDKNNQLLDVLLGYDNLEEYRQGNCYFGALVGRCANRIHGDVELDGITYPLLKNEGENVLHSGAFTTAFQVWDEVEEACDESALTLTLVDKEQEGGLPGNVTLTVRYELLEGGQLLMQVDGCADAKTILNVTSHGYFNLDGHESGAIVNQKARICATHYTPKSEMTNTPTGEVKPVKGTEFDFTSLREIGDVPYDHNYVLDNPEELAAEAYGVYSGIHMRMRTNCPCMQFYTAKWLEEQTGKNNAFYKPYQGFCFEPQYVPDAIHLSGFEKPVVERMQPYHFEMILQFDK